LDGLDSTDFLRSNANAVFNETGDSIDLRCEGDTDRNLLFLDGSANAVGIGTDTPASKLHVMGDEVRIGSGTPALALQQGDLYVQDDVEVGGQIWAKGNMTVAGALTANGVLTKSRLYVVTTSEQASPGDSVSVTCVARDANDVPLMGFGGGHVHCVECQVQG